jgi:FlaA1/EpsC-like NDP-sugar epimerase
MTLNYFKSLLNRHVPRWVVLNLDLIVSTCSFLFAYAIINNLSLNTITVDSLMWPTIIVLVFRLIGFLITRSYRGIVKYTSSQDAIRIFLALSVSSVFILVAREIYHLYTGKVFIPMSVIVMDYLLSLAMLTSLRLGFKLAYRHFTTSRYITKKHTIIYGANQTGIIAKRSIEADINSDLKIVAFVDESKKLMGKTAEGLPIFNFNKQMDSVISKYHPKEIIIADSGISGYRKKKIIELGLKHNFVVKSVPSVDNWVNGEFSLKQLRQVNIEDLLGRQPINLDKKTLHRGLGGKTVLITGAAGSIGSEIARQCLEYNPDQVILLDQAETPLYELEYSLNSELVSVVIGDVANQARVEKVFKVYKPDLVYHAAAYKHVPLMEDNPYEAITTNVFGTRILADCAVKYEVEKFVFVSTDKAVNPTNIMGASKRMAEMYVQSLNAHLDLQDNKHTKFITTRFGNVLGSNGSVIPRFKQQIEAGGPVTVTHPEISRFFMTIPEACQLVLEAGNMGNGGEIYIFDMGQSIKIVDLAEKMIQLSGYEVGKEIEVEFTGLRPGEKLHEELLSNKENTIGTHHPKIMIANVEEIGFLNAKDRIDTLFTNRDLMTNKLIVSIMKEMVPEYVSNNSIYEELDSKKVLERKQAISR